MSLGYYTRIRKIEVVGNLNQIFRDVYHEVSFDEQSLSHFMSGEIRVRDGELYIRNTFIPLSTNACHALVKKYLFRQYDNKVEFFIQINNSGGFRIAYRDEPDSINLWLSKLLGPAAGHSLSWSCWYH